MKRSLPLLLLLVLVSISACQSGSIALIGVDQEAWKADKGGCQGLRLQQLENVEAAWSQLQGMSQTQIERALGKPDQHELYRRSQKFFIYWVTPSPKCDTTTAELPKRLAIRFNATGFANELAVRTY